MRPKANAQSQPTGAQAASQPFSPMKNNKKIIKSNILIVLLLG
jgi:hypothetical protein